jgi:putative flippase GtrA
MSPAPQVVSDNPNASITGGVGAAVTLAVWLATTLGIEIPPEVSAALVTVVGFVVLYVGRQKKA